jgi:predicted membrane protein
MTVAAARALAFLAALACSAVLMIVPFLVVRQMTPRVHAVLPVMLMGVTGLFAYGLGFAPRGAIWRWLFSPWVAWAAVIGGLVLLVR